MSNRLVKNQVNRDENIGAELYIYYGKVFAGCGLVSFALMVFVSRLPQDYEKYNVPLFFGIWSIISLLLIAAGILLIVLSKKSKKFQAWAERDVEKLGKYLIEQELRKGKKSKS